MSLLKWLFRVWRGRCLGRELCDFGSVTTWDMRASVGRQSGCATTTTTTTTTRVLTLSNIIKTDSLIEESFFRVCRTEYYQNWLCQWGKFIQSLPYRILSRQTLTLRLVPSEFAVQNIIKTDLHLEANSLQRRTKKTNSFNVPSKQQQD